MRILVVLGAILMMVADPSDEATKRWWNHVKILAADDMEGRDTGSEGYKRAERYVVEQFEKAGLKPAGENGYVQTVPLRAVRLKKDESSIVLVEAQMDAPIRIDKVMPLRLYHDVTITPRVGMPMSIEAPLVFAGDDAADLQGKVAVTIAGGRPRNTGALGALTIDNPRAIEPARWPVAYATVMSIAGVERPAGPGVAMRFNSAQADKLFAGSGHTFAELLELAVAKKPLPTFPLKESIRVKVKIEAEDLKSDNILAVLPGQTDEYVAVSAHLDGYGFGEPVNGDGLYNGAFDDSAYVAELIELANVYKGKTPRRGLLFCVFTGEEKGLLGSAYFTSHFTIPKEKIVADINLDYLRPIFPLKILTTLGLQESTLGESVRKVAEPLGIRTQDDKEPERGLFRRSDQYNFIRNGIPGVAFIFGYENGSPEEATYRKWYAERYHRPSDDVNQPVNFAAAAKFNRFFEALVDQVANAEAKPRWMPGSQYAPK